MSERRSRDAGPSLLLLLVLGGVLAYAAVPQFREAVDEAVARLREQFDKIAEALGIDTPEGRARLWRAMKFSFGAVLGVAVLRSVLGRWLLTRLGIAATGPIGAALAVVAVVTAGMIGGGYGFGRSRLPGNNPGEGEGGGAGGSGAGASSQCAQRGGVAWVEVVGSDNRARYVAPDQAGAAGRATGHCVCRDGWSTREQRVIPAVQDPCAAAGKGAAAESLGGGRFRCRDGTTMQTK